MLKRRFLAVLLSFVLLVGLVPEYTSASKPYASEPSDEPGVSELSGTISEEAESAEVADYAAGMVEEQDEKKIITASEADTSQEEVLSMDSEYETSLYGEISSTETDSDGEETATWTYTVSNGVATITGYSGNESIVSVPAVLDDYNVEAIGNGVFQNNNKITEVELPEGLTIIGKDAFSGCTELGDIVFPKTIKSIGNYAFRECVGVERVEFTDNEKKEYYVSIGDYAFSGCSSLKTMVLSNNVKELGYGMIAYTEIKSITIPKNVSSCHMLQAYGGPLVDCIALENVVLEDGMQRIPDYLCSAGGNTTSSIKTVTIPSTVKEIGNYAFYNCVNLNLESLPEELTSIGERAFYECAGLGLENIIFPKTIKSIGTGAFYRCTGVKRVEFTENSEAEFYTSIGDSAFSGCGNLESIVLSKNVTSLGYNMIANTAIKSITIPKNVSRCNYIIKDGYGPLSNCKALESVVLEDGLREIPNGLCCGGSSIKTVTIPSTVKKIGDYAFYKCVNLELESFPEELTSIGDSAFSGCIGLGLENVIFPKTIESVGAYAFYGCTGVVTVEFTDNDKKGYSTSIGSYAFKECEHLETISLPKNVTTLGEGIIENTVIESITIPKSVSTCNGYPLAGCNTLENVELEDGIQKIPAYLCGTSSSYTSNIKTVTIPSTVKEIGNYAFSGCVNLELESLPEGLTSIGTSAFSGCIDLGLGNIIFPKTVESIGYSAFEGCTGIVSVEFTENDKKGFYTSIGDYAFSGCSSLETIELSENVTELGFYMIANTAITSITIPKSVNEKVF